MRRLTTYVLAVSMAVGLVANAAMAKHKSLYDRLGGEPAITAVVDDFVGRVAADNRINKFFAHANIPHLKKELVEQIGAATGGPQVYKGGDMKTVHKNMKISDADFDALVEDLSGSLQRFNVRQHDRTELLGILGGLKKDIVTVSTPAAPSNSLYDRLGGEKALKAVVDEFVARVAADERINHYFTSTDIPTFKQHLVEQLGQATGGPQIYTGRNMRKAHEGLRISEADWNALVEDLVGALDKFHVPEREKNELLGILVPMKPEIVYSK